LEALLLTSSLLRSTILSHSLPHAVSVLMRREADSPSKSLPASVIFPLANGVSPSNWGPSTESPWARPVPSANASCLMDCI
jgi:hypothetical protein